MPFRHNFINTNSGLCETCQKPENSEGHFRPTEQEEFDFSQDAGKGSEDLKSGDYQIPFLIVLQTGSPQVLENKPEYAGPDARPGRIFSTISQKCYKQCHIQPIRVTIKDVEWGLRTEGGGFVGYHDRGTVTDITVDKLALSVSQSQRRPNGNVIQPTYYMLVRLEEEDYDPVIVSMASTQIKYMRKWLGLMSAIKGTRQDGSRFSLPYFANTFVLSTVDESNKKGSWYSWKIDKDKPLLIDGHFVDDASKMLYLSAREVHQKMVEFLPKQLIPMMNSGDEETPF